MNGTHTRQDQHRKANAQQPGYEASTAIRQDARAEAAAAPAGPSSSASGALGEDKHSAAEPHLLYRLDLSLFLVHLLRCSCWCSIPIAAVSTIAAVTKIAAGGPSMLTMTEALETWAILSLLA